MSSHSLGNFEQVGFALEYFIAKHAVVAALSENSLVARAKCAYLRSERLERGLFSSCSEYVLPLLHLLAREFPCLRRLDLGRLGLGQLVLFLGCPLLPRQGQLDRTGKLFNCPKIKLDRIRTNVYLQSDLFEILRLFAFFHGGSASRRRRGWVGRQAGRKIFVDKIEAKRHLKFRPNITDLETINFDDC